jgi:hypothetical protein
MTRYDYRSKPDKCPVCGSARIAEVQYGLPAFTEELEKALNASRIILGGCCITGDDPAWQCLDCGTKIHGKRIHNVPS